MSDRLRWGATAPRHCETVDLIARFASDWPAIPLERGQVLFTEGDRPDFLYLVKSGALRIMSGGAIYEDVAGCWRTELPGWFLGDHSRYSLSRLFVRPLGPVLASIGHALRKGVPRGAMSLRYLRGVDVSDDVVEVGHPTLSPCLLLRLGR